jgi:hypothetical protein
MRDRAISGFYFWRRAREKEEGIEYGKLDEPWKFVVSRGLYRV